MKNNKLLIIFFTLTIILLFAISTIFSGCTKQNSTIDKIKETGKEASEEKETQEYTSEDKKTDNSEKAGELETNKSMKILYHITQHYITSQKVNENECFNFTFKYFLDGGIINQDGSNNEILDLKDYPTSMVTSKKYNNY